MDLHPTPFPGKRRPPSNPTKKDADRAKPSKNPPPPQPRPKRAFGVARNPNTPLEKPKPPQPIKTAKPWKPSGALPRPGRTAVTTTDAVSGGSSGKKKAEAKKNLRVGFLETPPLSQTVGGQGDGAITPVALIKPEVVGTPYLSALNCSKCRLDKLETAAYWLSQIGLAEAVGKHSVSAAFFRLALDCHAQPFHRIQSELRHYVARHADISMEASWKDLYEAYELSDGLTCTEPFNLDETDAVLVEHEAIDAVLVEQNEIGCNDTDETGSMMLKDGSLESNCDHWPHKDLSPGEQPPIEHVIDIDTCEAEAKAKAKKALPSIENLSLEKRSAGSNVSGKKSNGDKSKRASALSFNVSSSDTKARKSGGSAGKGGETSSQARSLLTRHGASPEVSVTRSPIEAGENPNTGGTEGDSKHVNLERTIQFKDLQIQ